MKVSYELKQGYIDVWNEESEEWDRYIKVNKKSVVKEKKIPEKLTQFEAPFLKGDKPDIRFSLIIDQINEIIDYLNSKGE